MRNSLNTNFGYDSVRHRSVCSIASAIAQSVDRVERACQDDANFDQAGRFRLLATLCTRFELFQSIAPGWLED